MSLSRRRLLGWFCTAVPALLPLRKAKCIEMQDTNDDEWTLTSHPPLMDIPFGNGNVRSKFCRCKMKNGRIAIGACCADIDCALSGPMVYVRWIFMEPYDEWARTHDVLAWAKVIHSDDFTLNIGHKYVTNTVCDENGYVIHVYYSDGTHS